MITKPAVDAALKQIDNEVRTLKISPKSLVKFTDSKDDQRFFSYFNGTNEYYHRALPLLINKLGLKNIVELGSREGVSTLCIWDMLPADARFTTIDLLKDQRYCPDAMYSDPRVNFIFGDVSDLSIFEGKYPFDIDLLFSDTIHYNFQVTDEFEIYQHFLADTCLFAIDDIHINDKGKFFEKIPYEKWDLTELYHKSGWGMFLYERKEKLTREERLLKAYQASAAIWKRKAEEQEAIAQRFIKRSPKHIAKAAIKRIKPLHSLLTGAYNRYNANRLRKRTQSIIKPNK